MSYARARSVTERTAELYRPPRRALASEVARAHLRNDRDRWDADLAPMMIEPLDQISSREYTGIVFVGPARSSKTFTLVGGGVCYAVIASPGDGAIVHISQDAARDFSRTDFDRMIRYSDALAERLSPYRRDDNTFDKFFRSGMMVKLSWPAVSQLSSKTLKYVWLTDYDRPENRDDVDGEGPLFDLAAKRIETYMSRGKVIAESSPGEEFVDRTWKASTPHEAPPAPGILSLYNRGTRARWYWRCAHCEAHFQAEPGLGNFRLLPKEREHLEKLVASGTDLPGLAEEFAKVPCPKCGAIHEQSERGELNRGAAWVHEGDVWNGKEWDTNGRRRSKIASYWLGGVAAAYQRWDSILLKHFQALAGYLQTNDERALKATAFTDQAFPYTPRAVARRRTADEFSTRSEDWAQGLIPAGVAFLITAIDVQVRSFVVQVHGFGVGLESWIVDRYVLAMSERTDVDGRKLALDPASYAEDWDGLKDVIEKTYPLDGVPGAMMGSHVTVCDSGGAEGVTQHAYDFWRKMRDAGHARRFGLVKGDGRPSAPRSQVTYPDTRRSGRDAGARGDIPVWMLATTFWKDAISGDLARDQRGPGFVHLPRWLGREFYEELVSEERNKKGVWERLKPGLKNEAFTLAYYARAAAQIAGAEKIDWTKPPAWAIAPKPGDKTEKVVSFAELAKGLNQ
jgi:phage terminase large subunit GpA-like protein